MLLRIVGIAISLLIVVTLSGQRDNTKILVNTDVNRLRAIAKESEERYRKDKAEALAKAAERGWIVRREYSDGTVVELMRLDDAGNPVYYATDNDDAATSIGTARVNSGGDLGLALDGNGMLAGEWDGGGVRTSHEQLIGRVSMTDGVTGLSSHATHVCGTIMASGSPVPTAKGMASQATVSAHDWSNDESEMATAAANGMLVSNHSYGTRSGWSFSAGDWYWYGDATASNTESDYFGKYDYWTAQWDGIAEAAPYYLIVKSAGNDRNDAGPPLGTDYYYADGTLANTFTDPHPADCNQGSGYDCLPTRANAKNILTVAAVEDVVGGYGGTASVVMSSFSGWGPTDDGRIKPDISANGVGLYSTGPDTDSDYTTKSGTSMAAPSVTGSLLLLQEHYENVNGVGSFMRAATLKALAIHTADEAGSASGPDYSFGWGLMNTAEAAQLITYNGTSTDHIKEPILPDNTTLTYTITATGSEPLVVTIAWTDPAGPSTSMHDDATSQLVNDLDLRVAQGTTQYAPYTLDPAQPSNAATTGDNVRDNVEQVYIASPTAGATYTITVNHKGSLSGGSQQVGLIITGNTSNYVPSYCSGNTVLTNPTGGLDDGSAFNDYLPNSNCTWLIQPTGSPNAVTLYFSSFDVHSSDTVRVYDGTTSSAALLGSFTGSTLPGDITSSSDAIFVEFVSDGVSNASGWSATYSSSSSFCAGFTQLTAPSGNFGDGSATLPYENNTYCTWLIQPPNAATITLDFVVLQTEANYDYVYVYDGDSDTAPLLGAYSGGWYPAPITGTSGSMYVVFDTDGSVPGAGWGVNYTSTTTTGTYCNGVTNLTAPSGTFGDGSGAVNYGANSDCSWLIQPSGATSITLNFSVLQVEPGYDYVRVYDGDSDAAPLLGQFTGTSLPSAVTSSGGSMYVRFTSDNTVQYDGWGASYTSTTTPTAYCSGVTNLTAASGSFDDGSGSDDYASNSDCAWSIQPTGATSITLSFTDFYVEQNYDFVYVYDGADDSAPLLATFTGFAIPANVTSSGGSMYVRFTSDNIINASGWSATYTSSNAPPVYCSGTTILTGPVGFFDDGSGLNNYNPDSDCSWLIQPSGAYYITLDFDDFDLENGGDYVRVYDGASDAAPLLGEFTGSTLPGDIVSTGGVMYVEFTSNGSTQATGWDASYEASYIPQPYCSGITTLTDSSGTFGDGSADNSYAPYSDCAWLIQPTDASTITLSFVVLQVESGYDYVRVYDGIDENAPLLGEFTGTSIPSAVTSTGGSMYVRFTSDDIVQLAGWGASYTSTQLSGGTFMTANLDSDTLQADPNSTTLHISTDHLWQLSGLPTWVVPGQVDGDGDASVTLTLAENTGNTWRTASFDILQNDGSGIVLASMMLTQVDHVVMVSSTSSDPLCYGDTNGSVVLEVNGGMPPYEYTWNSGHTTATIAQLQAGTYECTVTDALAQTMTTSAMTIVEPIELAIVNTEVTPASSNTAQDGSIELTLEGGTQPYSYVWSHGPTTADVGQLAIGSYTCTVTDANGCIVSTDEMRVDGAVSIHPISTLTSLILAPNPVREQLLLQLTLSQPEVMTVAVYDALGRRYISFATGLSAEHTRSIDMSHLPGGVYLVSIQIGDQQLVEKVIKE